MCKSVKKKKLLFLKFVPSILLKNNVINWKTKTATPYKIEHNQRGSVVINENKFYI